MDEFLSDDLSALGVDDLLAEVEAPAVERFDPAWLAELAELID